MASGLIAGNRDAAYAAYFDMRGGPMLRRRVMALGAFLALRDWEPFFTSTMEDDDDDTHTSPMVEKPTVLNPGPQRP